MGSVTNKIQSNKNWNTSALEAGSLMNGLNVENSQTVRTKDFIAIKPNANFDFRINGDLNRVVVSMYDKYKNFINKGDSNGYVSESGLFTTYPNAYYIKYRAYNADAQLFLDGNIQLVEVEVQTYTIPTQQPMIDESDYFDLKNKQEVHGWKKVVLDGTTNKFISKHTSIKSETHGFYQLTLENKTMGIYGATNLGLCNYLIWRSGDAQTAFNKGNGLWWEQYGVYVYAILPFTTLTEANNWLKDLYDNGKPLYIWYKLKEDAIEKLPCTSEQTAVLEEIRKKAKTYKGGTHIYSTDEVSPIFDVEYHVDMQSENEKIKQAIASLGGVI